MLCEDHHQVLATSLSLLAVPTRPAAGQLRQQPTGPSSYHTEEGRDDLVQLEGQERRLSNIPVVAGSV